MRLWDVTFVAARVVAVVLGARIVFNLAGQASFLWNSSQRWPPLVAAGLALVVAALLWKWSAAVADHVAFDADDLRPEGEGAAVAVPRAVELAALAFAIAGLVVALDGVVDAVRGIVSLVNHLTQDLGRRGAFGFENESFFVREDVTFLIAALARTAAGVFVFQRRDRLAGLVAHARPATGNPAGESAGDSA